MILLDNNQIILANVFNSLKTDTTISEDLIRHLLLNSYRYFRKTFHQEYGELVICQDSSNSWRKQFFPDYKANRAKTKQKSPYDWVEIYRILNILRQEVLETFPYKDMKIESAEADDIIAILAKHYHQTEKILIISNDKDFQQLQAYENVYQYGTIKRDYLKCENPYNTLVEHIIRGDSGDGIPNILSDDDTFVDETKRQKRMTDKIISEILIEVPIIDKTKHSKNWNRNSTLIDFSKIPEDMETTILEEYKKPKMRETRCAILPYMINHRLKDLISCVEEF